jgi:hypothetical protein
MYQDGLGTVLERECNPFVLFPLFRSHYPTVTALVIDNKRFTCIFLESVKWQGTCHFNKSQIDDSGPCD